MSPFMVWVGIPALVVMGVLVLGIFMVMAMSDCWFE